jgi:hypothetical protein
LNLTRKRTYSEQLILFVGVTEMPASQQVATAPKAETLSRISLFEPPPLIEAEDDDIADEYFFAVTLREIDRHRAAKLEKAQS